MDMKQVAERIIHVNPAQAEELIRSLQARIAELEASLTDWLAERAPTALTVEVLTEFGAKVIENEKWSLGYSRYMIGSVMIECMSGDFYILAVGWPIRTIGELRTLARLAGVELKQPESTPTNR